ncbi:hypothetical protein M9Y10_008832 [Tritrichomonas musculus]|uniref:TATA-box-binding protein n=1 Tax=Tritrichomonas musculus TaxID=1915356 RepID=A0ABR2IZ52_9EUKA
MDTEEFFAVEDNFDPKNLKKYETLAEVNLNEGDEDSDLPSTMKPVVSNLVACVQFGCEFDLYKIAQTVRNAEYRPRRFPAAILHILEPKATALIFKPGKMNIVGTKTRDDAYLAAQKFGRIMRKLNYKVKLQDFKITNIVASGSCNFRVGLEAIASNSMISKFAKYNPEIFSGLIFKIPDPQVTLLIFASGKIIFTGAKELDDLDRAAAFIMPILENFEIKMEKKIEMLESRAQEQQKEEEERKKKEEEELKAQQAAQKKSKHERRKNDPFFGKKPRT